MAIFIENGYAHRQTAGGEKVLHADSLFSTEHRLQAVRQIDRRHGIEVPYPWTRPLANPEQVVAALILRCVAVFGDPFAQAFQGVFAIDRHVTQAKIGHTEIFAANQKDPVQIVRCREVIAPVAHKPGQ